MDVEGIGKADEKVEERSVVNGFRNLRVGPSDLTQALDLLVRNAVGMPRQRFDEFEEQSVFGYEACCVQVPVARCGCGFRVLLTLQLQEPRMAAESIVAAVECRDIGGDHLVLCAT